MIDHAFDHAAELYARAGNAAWSREQNLEVELLRPFRLMKTSISLDGNKWCVLYGDNLQDGVAGFGDSPEEASREFDKAWYQTLSPQGVSGE